MTLTNKISFSWIQKFYLAIIIKLNSPTVPLHTSIIFYGAYSLQPQRKMKCHDNINVNGCP